MTLHNLGRRVFPTPVGMNRLLMVKRFVGSGVPHACGDEPVEVDINRIMRTCSPRLWG